MALYAIGDLHLCLGAPKPMDIFGGAWVGYMEKLRQGLSCITEEDTNAVLLASSLLMRATEGDEQALDRVLSMADDGGGGSNFKASTLYVMPSAATVEAQKETEDDAENP